MSKFEWVPVDTSRWGTPPNHPNYWGEYEIINGLNQSIYVMHVGEDEKLIEIKPSSEGANGYVTVYSTRSNNTNKLTLNLSTIATPRYLDNINIIIGISPDKRRYEMMNYASRVYHASYAQTCVDSASQPITVVGNIHTVGSDEPTTTLYMGVNDDLVRLDVKNDPSTDEMVTVAFNGNDHKYTVTMDRSDIDEHGGVGAFEVPFDANNPHRKLVIGTNQTKVWERTNQINLERVADNSVNNNPYIEARIRSALTAKQRELDRVRAELNTTKDKLDIMALQKDNVQSRFTDLMNDNRRSTDLRILESQLTAKQLDVMAKDIARRNELERAEAERKYMELKSGQDAIKAKQDQEMAQQKAASDQKIMEAKVRKEEVSTTGSVVKTIAIAAPGIASLGLLAYKAMSVNPGFTTAVSKCLATGVMSTAAAVTMLGAVVGAGILVATSDTVADVCDRIVSGLGDVVSGVVDVGGSVVKTLFDVGGSIVSGICDVGCSVIGGVCDFIGGLFD